MLKMHSYRVDVKLCGIARVAREIKRILTWLGRDGFAWPVAIWQTIVRAHAWRKCYHERRKSEEDAGMHACTVGTGWRGRVNAVRPCHVATTCALCETSSPRRSRNGPEEGGGNKERVPGSESARSRLSPCEIKLVARANFADRRCRDVLSNLSDSRLRESKMNIRYSRKLTFPRAKIISLASEIYYCTLICTRNCLLQ